MGDDVERRFDERKVGAQTTFTSARRIRASLAPRRAAPAERGLDSSRLPRILMPHLTRFPRDVERKPTP